MTEYDLSAIVIDQLEDEGRVIAITPAICVIPFLRAVKENQLLCGKHKELDFCILENTRELLVQSIKKWMLRDYKAYTRTAKHPLILSDKMIIVRDQYLTRFKEVVRAPEEKASKEGS